MGKIIKKHNLQLKIFGLPALIKMQFNSKLNLEYKTLITQENAKKRLFSEQCGLCLY